MITDVLSRYADMQANRARTGALKAPERIAFAMMKLVTFWEDKPCSEVSPASCAEYCVKRQDAGVGEWTQRRELGVLRASLLSVVGSMLTHAPEVKMPAPGGVRSFSLTRSQAARVLRELRRHPRTHHVARFFLVALETGTRPGTILRTRLDGPADGLFPWIDEAEGLYHRAGDKEKVTKYKKRGTCYPSPRLQSHIRRWKKLGVTFIGEYMGHPAKDVGKALEAACRKAKTTRITSHGLKHIAITWMRDAGMDIRDASQHTSTSEATLARHYDNPGETAKRRAVIAAARGGRRS